MIDLFRFGRTSLVLAAAALTLASSACNDDDDSTGAGAQGQLRVVHAVSDAPNLDVQIDDDAARAFANVPFAQVRPTAGYLTLDVGARRVRTYATGTSSVISDATVTLGAVDPMTILVMGRLSTTSVLPLVIADDPTAPAAGQIRVRVLHAASTAGPVDIYVTAPGAALPATATLAGLAYRAVSPYFEVPSAQYQVRAFPAGNRTTAIINVTTPFAVPAGNVITAVALDPPTGGAPSILLLTDRSP